MTMLTNDRINPQLDSPDARRAPDLAPRLQVKTLTRQVYPTPDYEDKVLRDLLAEDWTPLHVGDGMPIFASDGLQIWQTIVLTRQVEAGAADGLTTAAAARNIAANWPTRASTSVTLPIADPLERLTGPEDADEDTTTAPAISVGDTTALPRPPLDVVSYAYASRSGQYTPDELKQIAEREAAAAGLPVTWRHVGAPVGGFDSLFTRPSLPVTLPEQG